MIYEKKNLFKQTPCLLIGLILFSIAVFIVGISLDYETDQYVDKDSVAGSDLSIEDVENDVSESIDVKSVVVTTTTYETETSIPTEPEKFYYDCLLEQKIQDYISDLCVENNVPMDLIIAMISVESSFEPNTVSNTSDYGLMQINKINHEWFSKEYGITDFLDPYQNVFCGVKMIASYINTYEDYGKALMCYNMGEYGANKAWANGISSTSYSENVLKLMSEYEQEVNENARTADD